MKLTSDTANADFFRQDDRILKEQLHSFLENMQNYIINLRFKEFRPHSVALDPIETMDEFAFATITSEPCKVTTAVRLFKVVL